MNMKLRILSGAFLALAISLSAGDASAVGVELDGATLPAQTRDALRADIAKARGEVPELFKAVNDVVAHAKDLDAQARAPGVPLTLHFKGLGPRALMPLIDVLAFDGHPAARDLNETASSALRVGLIEAIGIIRDGRAVPVLAQALDGAREEKIVRASSEALSRIGNDEALGTLTASLQKADATRNLGRARAILSGMHELRREAGARLLATRLDAERDPDTAKVLAKSLGGVGNAWAWKTKMSQNDATITRKTAARALVDAYAKWNNADVREAAAKALLVVDEPSTPALIAAAKSGASRETVTVLEQLEQRFAQNPTR
jgi:hypothetical protein